MQGGIVGEMGSEVNGRSVDGGDLMRKNRGVKRSRKQTRGQTAIHLVKQKNVERYREW